MKKEFWPYFLVVTIMVPGFNIVTEHYSDFEISVLGALAMIVLAVWQK